MTVTTLPMLIHPSWPGHPSSSLYFGVISAQEAALLVGAILVNISMGSLMFKALY